MKRNAKIYGVRSQIGSHVAGSGITQAFYDIEESYQDRKIKRDRVRFSNDPVDGDFDAICKALSGEVKTYKLGE